MAERAKVKAAAAKVKAPKVAPEAPKAEAPKADPAAYEPIADDLLWRKGMRTEDVAEREAQSTEPGMRKRFKEAVTFRRNTLERRLGEIAQDASDAGNDVDSTSLGRLYHQMDHSHRRADAERHLAHWTSKMDPSIKKAVYDAVTPLLKLWKE